MRKPFVSRPRVSVLRLQGKIASGPSNLNDATLAPLIERAFRRRVKAVALEINCPGGSPTQSALIGARIRRLAEKKKIPVYAFIEDVGASGGYWIATAADKIYADRASIVGSIGVISAGFGAKDLIERYGVERRLYTAGGNKSFMDPFQEEKPEEVARLKELLDQLHVIFTDQVKARRGAKLSDDPELFSGKFWLGDPALERGLIDGIGHMVPVMKATFGADIRFQRFQKRRSLLRRFGMTLVGDVLADVEERAAFARFGR